MAKVLKFLQATVFLAIYLSSLYSLVFAFRIFSEPKIVISFIVAFLLIFLLSWLIRMKYPSRFIEGKSLLIYITLTFSISFFLLGLIYEQVEFQWRRFVDDNTPYITFADSELTSVVLMILLLFGLIYPIWHYYSRKKGLIINFFIAFIVMTFWLFLIFVVARPDSHSSNLLENIYSSYRYTLYNKIVPFSKTIVSYMAVGWFSELFIGTLVPKEVRKKYSEIL